MEMMIYTLVSVKNNPERLKSLLTGIKGISDVDLYAIFCAEIAAVVCNIKKVDLIANQECAIRYADVIEILSRQFTLLPVRFGSILASEAALMQVMATNYTQIHDNLQKVENKFEFGLKVFCDSEKILAELKSKSQTKETTPDTIESTANNSIYRDWVNKKLKEHRIEESLLNYVDTVIATLTEKLIRLKTINKIKKMITATTIIDAVFLLDKEKKEAMIKIIADLQTQYASINFVLTGPWPPYNFVEISIK